MFQLKMETLFSKYVFVNIKLKPFYGSSLLYFTIKYFISITDKYQNIVLIGWAALSYTSNCSRCNIYKPHWLYFTSGTPTDN